MTRSRSVLISARSLALAMAAACATAAPGSDEDVGDRIDAGIDQVPPPLIDAGNGNGLDGGADSDCPTDPCDLHEQCGCADGDACDLEFTNFDENEFTDQLACRGVLTPGDELATCSSPSNCAPGYQCIGGQCRRYCRDDDVCGGPGGECALTRAGSERSDDRLCTKSCEPDFEADHSQSCPGGFSCYIRFVGPEGERRPVTDCLSTGAAGLDEDCSEARCGEGLTCVVFTNSETGEVTRRACRHLCRVDDQTCPNEEPCSAFSNNPVIIEGTEYGLCET